ncbi:MULTISPECIES: AMP-dependent synthetase/ligase [unclassified Tenacibaculum]|uniref:AMP-dependent synthetase/ligase n=1 Tax=unclassified Tenacibaculum TaxID=2635139 RepID=UPI001F450CEA|nr:MULTISPECIES: long-chain fatty acid--CoA ligase [unclassified Tenacibaculum]MCF2875112.1 long-chain fatty acid--CoA ligase [Tenacibaculum sp. Cn5-1]MCF2935188.1 long-chain fatty acid--CoA ligase [Tenacibaculum sp. Cn5-34]MCG7511370.1 long-chain fatty acid--CoA ligase [Tenacibaculum sp. Cn5-46]
MQKPTEITRLFDFPYYQLHTYPQQKCLVYKEENAWKNISTQNYIEQANQVSRALLKLGIKKGDKIAVITSVNQPKWHILDIGVMQIGAINVPLYPTFSEKDYAYILNHSDSVFCFVSDDELYQKVIKVQDQTQIKKVYTFEEIDTDYSWTSFLSQGKNNELQSTVESSKNNVQPEDLATIIYTSGTTGTPKGVMLSHQNVVSNIFAVGNSLDLHDNRKKAISYLPICHIFERAASYYCQYMGFEIHFAESIEKIGDNLKEVKPNFMAVVPRLLEKVFDKIVDKGSNLSGIKKRLFFWALKLGEQYKPYKANGWWYEFQLGIARKLIFSKWQEALGGQLDFMLAGSAPMQPRLIKVFTAAGIPVFEGYGMTETSPAVSVTDMRNNGFKIGTVGRIIKDVEVKIANDGEILVKGPNVMMGYYKNEEQTNETIKNDYLHTGDIGEIDSEGFLKITDRKKEIFKTSGGKYIAPAVLESELKKSRFIEQVMVIGESERMPAALIQVSFEFVYEWAKRHHHTITDISTDQKLINRIQKEIDYYNKKFGNWEQIKRFEITSDEWTTDAGHLTPTLKMRRKIILEKYNDLYKKIYNSQ